MKKKNVLIIIFSVVLISLILFVLATETLDINSPTNTTYETNEVIFNVTATDSDGVDSCWFSLDDGENVSLSNVVKYTIQLQDANTENLEDTSNNEYPDNNESTYGDLQYLRMDSGRSGNQWRGRTYIMWNISVIDDSTTIEDSQQCFYSTTYNDAFPANVDGFEVYNSTWNEDTLNWVNQPCGIEFDDSSNCDLNAFDNANVTDIDQWFCFNSTEIIEKNKANDTVSFAFYCDPENPETRERVSPYSKEVATSSLRPYLNITYSVSLNFYAYTNSSMTEGFHNVNFYCNDTLGNLNISTQYFTVDTTPPANLTNISLTETLLLSNQLNNKNGLDRKLTQDISSSNIINRLLDFFRSQNKELTISENLNKNISMQRYLTNLLTFNKITSRIIYLDRNQIQTLTISNIVNSNKINLRSVLNAILLNDNLNRLLDFSRNQNQLINTDDNLIRNLNFFRNTNQEITTNNIASYDKWILREAFQTFVITDNINRLIDFSRGINQEITISDISIRKITFSRTINQIIDFFSSILRAIGGTTEQPSGGGGVTVINETNQTTTELPEEKKLSKKDIWTGSGIIVLFILIIIAWALTIDRK